MTVGFHAPLPPAPTGVADYAANLVKALRAHGGAVEVNNPAARSNVQLYHVGNNSLHRDIYFRALREPGIVVLHDAVLHHFLLGVLGREQYVAEFRYNYGEWSESMAAGLWNLRGLSASDERYFQLPMLRRICETSKAVIVHNAGAAKAVRSHAPSARVIEIPHLYVPEPVPSGAEVVALRRELGFAPGEFVCGVFGYLRESKRIRSVIAACAAAGIRLLVAGSCPEHLNRSLGPSLRLPWIVRHSFASPRTFRVLRHAVDVCANLRYPTAHETSGIAIAMMGAGKPVVLSNSEENARYPEDGCVKVESGLAERDHLTTVLQWLREFRAHARAIGAKAAAHIGHHHRPEQVAELYWRAVREVA